MSVITEPRTTHIAVILSVTLILAHNANAAEIPDLTGPYLGQKLPGTSPEIFAPGIIGTNNYEGCSAFLNEESVFVFNRSTHGESNIGYIPILEIQMKNEMWTGPKPVSFQNGQNDDNFTISPDGKTLYFQSNRSTDDSGMLSEHSNIWRTTLNSDGWSEPEYVRTVGDEPLVGGYPSITRDGTLYFMSSVREGYGDLDIFRSRSINGKYPEVENIGNVINSEFRELDSFIAPDESYLIFCSNRPGSKGEYDLYIAYRNADDTWTEPINMGDSINVSSAYSVTRPSVTPDGKYFFFVRHFEGRDDIYWVNTDFIERLRPAKQ